MVQVLIVENEKNIRLLIKTILRQIGHTTIQAEDGLLALDMLKSNSPDLIITDLEMPHMNGVQMIDEIYKDGKYPPIIVTSAYPNMILEALKEGAGYQLKKPFTRNKLVEIVNQAIDGSAPH